MSKNAIQLKSAIQNLNMKKPYDLRAQSQPKFQPPKDIQIEHTQKEIAQSEATLNEHAQIRPTRNGFFMLAHSVFENELTRELTGDAFKVFIWMSSQAWRFQASNGEFRGAVEYIAVVTGCSRATVTRSLSSLKSLGLIECVEKNNSKGNLWSVSSIASGRGKNKSDQIEDTQDEPTQNESTVCSKRAGSVLKLKRQYAQNEQHIISSNKINNNSQEAAESQKEFKMIWEKFTETFPNEAEQKSEIEKLLAGLPFSQNLPFARNLALTKWWDGKNGSSDSASNTPSTGTESN